MTLTVSAAIAQQIGARGIQRIYQVPGESYLGLLDALRDESARLVTARHEGGAGFMAVTEARLTGRVGVAMVTRGPGAANVAIAVHTAYQDATPIVVFIGLIPRAEREREAFQEFDVHAWFGSTAKAVMVLDDPDSAAERVARAFDIAESGRPGPVVVGLPEELLLLTSQDDRVYPPKRVASQVPNSEVMHQFIESLKRAKRPVFVVGGDDWDEQAAGILRTVAEDHAVPVVSDFRAHDAFPHSSPAWVGSLGFGRNEGARSAYDDADLVCYLGTTRKDVLSDGFVLGDRAETVVVVNPDPELREHTGRVDTHFVSSPSAWLTAFPSNDAAGIDARHARLVGLREVYRVWSKPEVADPEKVSREAIFDVLQRTLPDDSIVTVGAGNYAIGPLRYLHHERPRSFVGPRNGAMGLGIPGAVAASLVAPERTTVAFAGDGCFGMNGQELATLQMYGGRALIFLIDNGGYGTIHSHQENYFPGRPSGTYLVNPDYVAIARAHGIVAHRVDRMTGFAEHVAEALQSTESVFFHIQLPQINAGTGLHDGTGLDAR